jgi:chitinase
LQSTVARHDKVLVVNVKLMDYGFANSPDSSAMGEYEADAATATEDQLASVYPGLSALQLWAMIGITPVVGQNNLTGEIFTIQDATQVANFVRSRDISRRPRWRFHRHTEYVNDADVHSNQCSSTTQVAYQLASIFGAVPAMASSSPPPSTEGSGTTAPSPNLTLSLKVSSSWYGNPNMPGTVTNSGTSSVTSWEVGIALRIRDTITNAWNAAFDSSANTTPSTSIAISNVSHTGKLTPGGIVSFGF